MKLLKQVSLDRANRRKDRSVSLTFITELEQTPEEFMEIDTLLNDSGLLYFKSNGKLSKEEIKALDDTEIEINGKTKSQRLRNVFYVYCEQNDLELKDFYDIEMEKIILHYKDKLV